MKFKYLNLIVMLPFCPSVLSVKFYPRQKKAAAHKACQTFEVPKSNSDAYPKSAEKKGVNVKVAF